MCHGVIICLTVIVSILALTSCGDERRPLVNNGFVEGVAGVFLIERSAGDGAATVCYENGASAISGVRISYFAKSAQLAMEAVATKNVRVLAYVRSDSDGVPALGPSIPSAVDADLPAGPRYHIYQELVVMSVLGENSDNKVD